MSVLRIKDGFKGERSLTMPEMILRIAAADPVLKNLHITDIGYYPHATYHYRERVQPIDQCVLIYCVKGSGKYKVAGREYEVKANQFFILPAMTPHAYASNNNDPWTIYWIHFRGTLADFYAEGALAPQDVSASINSRIADRNNIFEDIFSVLSDGYSLDNLRYTSSLLHFYLGSLRYLPLYRRFHSTQETPKDEETENIVNAALKYMDENIEGQITLLQLSKYTGYSPSHFSSIFKTATGHSPLSYFNLMKIKYACQLLDTTEMKINQICCKVGIDDSYYFSRLFKKTVGISPRQYRESRDSRIG
jgi:AraC family transcriptional regulator, arabinose operon regulatory protein